MIRLLRRKCVPLGVGLLFSMGGLSLIPASASAEFDKDIYCFNSFYYGETCPGNGGWEEGSEWLHLEFNAAWDPYHYGSAKSCIDEFLDPNGNGYYTGASCSYKTAEQYVGYVWGFPRAWNGEGTKHVVEAEEYGWE